MEFRKVNCILLNDENFVLGITNSYRVIVPEYEALESSHIGSPKLVWFLIQIDSSKNSERKKNKFQEQTDKQINWVSRATHIFYPRICVTFIFILSYRNRMTFTVLSTDELRKNLTFTMRGMWHIGFYCTSNFNNYVSLIESYNFFTK